MFLVLYTGTVCAATSSALLWRDRRSALLRCFLLLGLFAVSVGIAGSTYSDGNVFVRVLLDLASLNRTLVFIAGSAVACGALVSLAMLRQPASLRWHFPAIFSIYAFSVLCFAILLLKDRISPYLPDPSATAAVGVIQQETIDGYRLEKLADLSIAPTAMAIGPNQQLYVAGYSGIAFQNGVIVEIDIVDGSFSERVVAKNLNRPHGIAFHDGDLYVSRSGQHSTAKNGVIRQHDTGAITRLSDLDGDGIFDRYDDVVTGLPGAQLPDGLHTNNGISFDEDGTLYITVGAPSDDGPAIHKLAGSILRVDADGKNLEIFAEGLRNPFDLTFGPNGSLFCTDNDANARGHGDELNHVVKDNHYGHPYSVHGTQVTGTTAPILQVSSAQGLAYASPSDAISDELPNGCLYVASYGDDHVNRITLEATGETYEATLSFFASIPSPIDVVVQDDVLFVCSHHGSALYRIVPSN